ncbi:MAG: AMP-binding protein [Oscillospiraceae bacterium]|nr:AMP-binding protein [Oscillospiraceae bacterium]
MKISFQDGLICRQEGFHVLTRQALEERQLELLNMQLRRAVHKGAFYRDYPERLDSLEQLSQLPFTDERTLRDSFAELCLSPGRELVRLRTSGTTGTPKRMAYSKYDCERTRMYFAVGLTELIYPGDRVLCAFPQTDENSLGGLIASAVKTIGADIRCLSGGESFGEMTALAESDGSSVYVGPPVLLLSLLRLMGKKTPLRRALVSSDVCPSTVRAACEEALGTRIFTHYGLRESGLGGAMECQAHEGMHVRENDLIFEIVGEEGERLPDGAWGELVLTSIGLEALPLFRYRTGDRGRFVPGRCPCGSVVRRLETTGRLKTPAGSRLDDAVFRCTSVIDARMEEGTVSLLVLGDERQARRELEALLPGRPLRLRAIERGDGPFFRGKRNGLRR